MNTKQITDYKSQFNQFLLGYQIISYAYNDLFVLKKRSVYTSVLAFSEVVICRLMNIQICFALAQ